jgi:hypothetical protein
MVARCALPAALTVFKEIRQEKTAGANRRFLNNSQVEGPAVRSRMQPRPAASKS